MVTVSSVNTDDASRKPTGSPAESEAAPNPATTETPEPGGHRHRQAGAQADEPGANALVNVFEHWLSKSAAGEIGAIGNHAETAIKLDEIVRVGALVFDIDAQHLTPELAGQLPGYLNEVLPQLELRQTSASGNLHAILHFKNPVTLGTAEKIWATVRKLVLADPSARILAKARVVGTRKIKNTGDTCVVKHVKDGSPVSAKELLTELVRVPADKNGDRTGASGWKRRQFRAVMKLLAAPNGERLWDGIASHGVCPIHGSGANPTQCAMRPEYATCSCFADCGDEAGKPRTITLAGILAHRVISGNSWDKFRPYFEDAPKEVDGRPVVIHDDRQPLSQFYSAIISQFAATGRHFLYGNTLCEIVDRRIEPSPNPDAFVGAVVSQMEIATFAQNWLLYRCLSKAHAAAILHSRGFLGRLLPIDLFTEAPVFDKDLRLVDPGYNQCSRIYYAGAKVVPADEPVCLPRFLDVVNFRERASLANFVGALLTNFFSDHFRGSKPAPIFDANRPGVGKTMLGRCVAAISTARPTKTVTYNPNDEELEKRLATEVLTSNYVLIDNAKTKRSCEVSSAVLERSITDEQVSFRQLGFNRRIERPNGILWMLSMNNARLSPDLTDRGLPIRLRYQGDPGDRKSPIGDPWEYFLQHRVQITAELLGMIMRWIAAGCPESAPPFRFRAWAHRIGGILEVNGFNDFLANLQHSRVEFDPVLSALHTLAGRWPDQYKKAGDWATLLQADGLLPDVWAGVPLRGQATKLGQLFQSYRGQTLNVALENGLEGEAELTARSGHAGTEWGFVLGSRMPSPDSPSGGGEPGEPQDGGSPAGSPSEHAARQEVTGDGEPGEPQPTPQGKKDTSPAVGVGGTAVGGPEGAPGKGSSGSPGAPERDVTPCRDNELVMENLPVSPPTPAKGVHHEDQPRSSALGTTQLGSNLITYEIGWDGNPLQAEMLAIDTETTVTKDKTAIPDLVLGTASDGQRHVVMAAHELPGFIAAHNGHTLVFHNLAFDFWVLDKYFVSTGREVVRQLLWSMARAGQLRDTMLLDQLVTLGRTGARPVPRDLGKVAAEFARLDLDKGDPYRMRYAEIRELPLDQVDKGFLDYAVKDAVATIHAYAGLADAARGLMQRYATLYDSNLATQYGLLTETIQVQGAIALAAISRHGMHVDGDRLDQLRQQLEERRDELVAAVDESIPDGIGSLDHGGVYQRDQSGKLLVSRSGSPRVNKKRLQAVLEEVLRGIKDQGIRAEIPRTPRSDEVSLKAEYWTPLRQHHPFVDRWLQLNELAKLIQFTQQHTSSRVHPKYTVLVRTGRTSCSSPNIQQLPRSGGIRECFIPTPGHVFLAVDYTCIELRTLAAVCEHRFGASKLADVIRQGVDPHCHTAALIRGVSLDEFMAIPGPERKADRQRAKAVNFGVPGGLGVDSLVAYAANSFGVALSTEDAQTLRDRLISEAYPELADYLHDDPMAKLAVALGVSETDFWQMFCQDSDPPEWLPGAIRNVVRGRTRKANGDEYNPEWYAAVWENLQQLATDQELASVLSERRGSEQLMTKLFGDAAVATLTGRIRATPTFTQARNTPFQGLASDGAKLALFELVRAGFRVAGFVHDEVLVELPKDADHDAEAKRVDKIMCESMQRVTGAVPIECGKPVLMERWSKDAEPAYDEQKRLTVWRPEATVKGEGQ